MCTGFHGGLVGCFVVCPGSRVEMGSIFHLLDGSFALWSVVMPCDLLVYFEYSSTPIDSVPFVAKDQSLLALNGSGEVQLGECDPYSM